MCLSDTDSSILRSIPHVLVVDLRRPRVRHRRVAMQPHSAYHLVVCGSSQNNGAQDQPKKQVLDAMMQSCRRGTTIHDERKPFRGARVFEERYHFPSTATIIMNSEWSQNNGDIADGVAYL